MLNNKADIVENYLLRQLAEQSLGYIEVSRSELADKIRCAPSQISYVLSTRFTTEKGFIVESQRGLGGYIRITIIDDPARGKDLLYNDMIKQIKEDTPFETVKGFLTRILADEMITRREFTIIAQTILNFYRSENNKEMTAAERAKLTRSMFATLANIG